MYNGVDLDLLVAQARASNWQEQAQALRLLLDHRLWRQIINKADPFHRPYKSVDDFCEFLGYSRATAYKRSNLAKDPRFEMLVELGPELGKVLAQRMVATIHFDNPLFEVCVQLLRKRCKESEITHILDSPTPMEQARELQQRLDSADHLANKRLKLLLPGGNKTVP